MLVECRFYLVSTLFSNLYYNRHILNIVRFDTKAAESASVRLEVEHIEVTMIEGEM